MKQGTSPKQRWNVPITEQVTVHTKAGYVKTCDWLPHLPEGWQDAERDSRFLDKITHYM